ncbi:MAG: sigma factor-like helix-turn-helix DNA-binding protein [Planctomycetota bacterium]|jgi:DNA-directed RNA polymerase specialized sigma24 family protein
MNDRHLLDRYDLPDQRPELRAGLEALKDRVLARADTLEAAQRALLTAILDQGSSYQQVARLRGEHASTVSRRFRRLLRKLSQRTGGKAGVRAANLKAMDKTILTAYYLFGMNQLQIAARLGISRYRVRKTLSRFAAQQRGGA